MARIRTIKPEFWTDEAVGECSPNARLLFLGTLNFADDHGGIERSAKQLKAQIFPYDNIDCETLVQELLGAGLLVEYEVDGKKFLHIKGFRLHQKVEKPGKPRVPLYEPSANIPRSIGESSGKTPRGRESKGREGNGKEGITKEQVGEGSANIPRIFPELSGKVTRGTHVVPDDLLAQLQSGYPAGTYRQDQWLIGQREAERRLEEGETLEDLLAGVRRYAAQCEAKGSVGSQFVLSPAKFFARPSEGGPPPYRDPFPLPAQKQSATERLLGELDRQSGRTFDHEPAASVLR